MAYNFNNTTPVYEDPPEGEERTPFPNVYDKAYETVRPTCHYDLRKIDYFVPEYNLPVSDGEIIESTFTQQGVTYDYFEDYEKWAHIESDPPYPLIGFGNAVPPPSVFTDVHQSYGFNYSSKMGIGNRKYNWLSHTDLDLSLFKVIRDNIRRPILKEVKEAKQRQDILGACAVQKYFKKLEQETGTPAPQFPEIKFYAAVPEDQCEDPSGCPDIEVIVDCFASPPEEGYPEDCPPNECQDWSCKKLEEVINNIPLECELIQEYLGPEYIGVDFDRYWWDGYSIEEGGLSATKKALSVIQSNERVDLPQGFLGTTFTEPNFGGATPQPPYQHIIGVYKCPVDGTNTDVLIEAPPGDGVGPLQFPDLKDVIQRPDPEFPFYGFLGGYTADACGCVDLPERLDEEGQPTTSLEGLLPDYITKCGWPNQGPKFNEYLQYIGSEDVRYWNTPYETPLYRKAQLQMLFSSEVDIETPGDFNIKVGSIIRTVFPVSVNSESPASIEENQLNGRWLVVKIKHIFQSPSLHKMKLTCVRDSKYPTGGGGSLG